MARRREAGAGRPGADGVVGMFERTEQAWRALGAPASLYDDHEAARAWQRVTQPWYGVRYLDPRDALDPDRKPLTDREVPRYVQSRQLAAKQWWRMARPVFLEQADALTGEELRQIARRPALCQLFGPAIDVAKAEAELLPTNNHRAARKRRVANAEGTTRHA